ncbi:MAG: hypothetical protein LQ352_005258 [Teloschistes flavicans]|nr:MAG: hypothetical protein LQ352_005258 [Teloschistes flavicans]
MSTPIQEFPQPQYPAHNAIHTQSDDDEGTLSGEYDRLNRSRDNSAEKQEFLGGQASHAQSREEENRLTDDLAMLQAERVVSNADNTRMGARLTNSASMRRSRSRAEPVDQFDINTNPIHEKTATFRPPENPTGHFAKTFKRIHEANFLFRYFSYIVPVVLVLLIPLLLGALVFKDATVGDVRLMWFCVWLEIVWLTLWSGRITAHLLPYPAGLISSLFTNNSKKFRDMFKQLEIPATLFFWTLGVEISFLPTMIHHHKVGGLHTKDWEINMNKILVSLLVGASLNFIEKIIIQLIAISFHLRTYSDRIELNKFQIGSLTKLYQYSKEKIAGEDSDFEDRPASAPGSGARTPMVYVEKAHKQGARIFNRFGDAAGKVAADFTGRGVTKSTHPRQVVLTLLSSTSGSQVLARRLYRTFVLEDAETVSSDDLKHAFDNDEEAESAFAMFDKDMNGDISMSELEAVCVDIGRERKSITASLKDLDSVVSKLDAVLLFFVVGITILVLLSLISSSAAASLTSAGSAVLALSWLFSSTAQEFLASCIFVLVKHPFDCGDRVYIYGSSGSQLKGDDYIVKNISLLYTEFKKMEGHIVQAPNSYLNTLFIQNMRRSGGLAEAVPLTVKFGTTLDQIDDLRQRLLEFVKSEKREYQPNILTEIRSVDEAHSVNLNVVFFYKSNWQNELLRLQRRNKFICALMISMQEVGIEGPLMRLPGQKEDAPYYVKYSNPVQPPQPTLADDDGPGPRSGSLTRDTTSASDVGDQVGHKRSILRRPSSSSRGPGRPRGESISAMAKRVDFSLGMKDVSSGDMMGDLYESVSPNRLPQARRSSASRDARERIAEEEEEGLNHQKHGRSSSRNVEGSPRFGIHRSSTAESGSRVRRSISAIHRNRFFSRPGRRNSRGEYEDLMEQGMADIPESAGPSRSGTIDPRSGVTSTQAVRMTTESDVSRGTLPGSTTHYPETEERRLGRAPARSQTENFEMRDMKR